MLLFLALKVSPDGPISIFYVQCKQDYVLRRYLVNCIIWILSGMSENTKV